MSELPLEKLKKMYIPVSEVPEKYGISVDKVMSLIESHKIKYAEFRAPGEMKRTPHVNYEELLIAVEKEKESI